MSSERSSLMLRFRINMLLAQRDMTVKQLYEKVKTLGCTTSSSHFYRQMKPYFTPVRLDVLAYVVRALKIDASELFELVEVEADDAVDPKMKAAKNVVAAPAKKLKEKEEVRLIKAAQSEAKQKKAAAMMGARIVVSNAKQADDD